MGLGDSYLSTPAILIFSDTTAGLANQEHAIHRLEGRIGAREPIESAVARIEEAASIGAVVVDASMETPELERLLDRLEIAARDGRFRSVVAVTPDLIDLAAARCPHSNVTILCDSSEAENVAALALALAGAAPIPQFGWESGPARLKQLSEEVGRIAKTLAALSETEATPPIRVAGGSEIGELPSAALIRSCIRMRRMREQYFSAELFADPAWDMLLDLMAARIEARSVAVSSLCIAAAVPATTGLRWIKTLTDEGLFIRVADPHDGRRIFIELSEAAARGMAAYFQSITRAGLIGG
jgi:hypothetical protein